MLRILSLVGFVAVVVLIAWGTITLYDENLQVGRMWETPAIRPHEKPLPVMANVSVPIVEGEIFYRKADPQTLTAPFSLNDPAAIKNGQQGYVYYCIQCHGRHHDGNGTVGQSFAPLPGDLRSTRVQSMPAGQMFHEISFGLPDGRQPPLASTISSENRWQIIAFVKSLGVRP